MLCYMYCIFIHLLWLHLNFMLCYMYFHSCTVVAFLLNVWGGIHFMLSCTVNLLLALNCPNQLGNMNIYLPYLQSISLRKVSYKTHFCKKFARALILCAVRALAGSMLLQRQAKDQGKMWRTRSELCKICKLTAFINYCPVQYITVFVQRISRRPGIEALVRLPLRHLYIVPVGGGRFLQFKKQHIAAAMCLRCSDP